MKGLSTALVIVVTAIVLLIIAVVVVTIFGGAIAPLGGLAEARNNCQIQYTASCSSAGDAPVNWDVPTQRYNQQLVPCSRILSCTCPSTRVASCRQI